MQLRSPLRSLLATSALALGAASAAASPQDTAWLEELALQAYPPGAKETPENVHPLRFGWMLEDTGELRGGSYGVVAELAKLHFAGQGPVAYASLEQGGISTRWQELGAFYDGRYWAPHGSFGDGDLERALAAPAVDFLAVDGSVFAPTAAAEEEGPGVWPYPGLLEELAPEARRRGVSLAAAAGFTNDSRRAAGEWQYNYARPLVTLRERILGKRKPYDAVGLLGHPEEISRPFFYRPLSILWPDVAAAVEADLRARVLALGGEQDPFAYHIVGLPTHLFGGEPLPSDARIRTDRRMRGAEYHARLSVTDYSDASIIHFRRWLELRHGTDEAGLADLGRAWRAEGRLGNQARILLCPFVDPLYASYVVTDFGPLLADWTAFQREQILRGVIPFQVAAAKSARPDQQVALHATSPDELERALLGSDAGVLRAHHGDGATAGQIPGPLKRVLLHGVTYGDPLHLPFTTFPRAGGTCWGAGSEDERPDPFTPPCWDVDGARRGLIEATLLGADSLGVASFEGGNRTNIIDGNVGEPGESRTLMDVLGAEVEGLRPLAAGTSPWRSPILVHTGEVKGGADLESFHAPHPGIPYFDPNAGSTERLFEALANRQVQFAPFANLEALGDLWVASEREVLVSAFVTDLGHDDIARYAEVARAQGLEVVLLLEFAQGMRLFPGGVQGAPIAGDAAGPRLLGWRAEIEGQEMQIWLLHPSQRGDAVEALEPLADHLIAMTSGGARPVRATFLPDPITAELPESLFPPPFDPEPEGAGPPSPFWLGILEPEPEARLDVTVASDGLALWVGVTNAEDERVRFVLECDLEVPAPLAGRTVPQEPQVLAPGESRAFRLAPVLAEEQAASLALALDEARTAVDAREAQGFDVTTARGILDHLRGLPREGRGGHLAALLVRLHRLPFLRFDVTGGEERVLLEVVDLAGRPLPDCRVQVEYVLQLRARRDFGPTDEFGRAFLDCARLPIEAAPTWDFTLLDYVRPARSLVEVHVQDPRTGVQVASRAFFVDPEGAQMDATGGASDEGR